KAVRGHEDGTYDRVCKEHPTEAKTPKNGRSRELHGDRPRGSCKSDHSGSEGRQAEAHLQHEGSQEGEGANSHPEEESTHDRCCEGANPKERDVQDRGIRGTRMTGEEEKEHPAPRKKRSHHGV